MIRIVAAAVMAMLIVGCSKSRPLAGAMELQSRFTGSCLGAVSSNAVEILGPGESAWRWPLPAGAGMQLGRVSRDGRVVAGWNVNSFLMVDLQSKQTRALDRVVLESTGFDLSGDGSK